MLEDSVVKMSVTDDQQFCLRWNNFQAYITSQFEALRDDEDFVDVTLACEGQRLGAHKVVLSACSPFFKELFKVCIFLHTTLVVTVAACLHWNRKQTFTSRPCITFCLLKFYQ